MWFLCQRHDKVPRDKRTVTLDEHLVWMRQRHEEGTIVMSGPAPGRGISMYLIRAESEDRARSIAAGDPFTAGGDCTFEIIPWEIHQILGAGAFTAAGLGRK